MTLPLLTSDPISFTDSHPCSVKVGTRMKRCRGKKVATSVTHEKTSNTEFEKLKVWIRWQFRCSVLPFGSKDSFQCSKAEDVISASSGQFSTHTVRFQGRLLHSDCNWIQFFSVGNEVRRCSGTCNPTAQCVWDLCLFICLFFHLKMQNDTKFPFSI